MIYYAVVIAAIIFNVLMVGGQHVNRGNAMTRRMMIGVGGAFAAWMLLLVAALWIIAGNGSASEVLFTIERAAILLTVTALGWAFATAHARKTPRRRTRFAIAVAGLTMLAFAAQLAFLGTDAALAQAALIWLLALLTVLIVGVAAAVRHQAEVVDMPLKLLFVLVLIIGTVAAIFQQINGAPLAALGNLRVALVVAVGLSCAVVYRTMTGRLVGDLNELVGNLSRMGSATLPIPIRSARPAPAMTPTTQAPAPEVVAIPGSATRESTLLLRALGMMIENTAPQHIPMQIVRAALEMVRADLGVLMRVQDANYADVVVAFDRARSREAFGLSINLDNQPTLVNAVERKQQRPLFIDRNEAELLDIYSRFGIEQLGPAYLQPLTQSGELIGLLLVGFPFANRELSDGEAEILKGVGIIAGGLLALSDRAEEMRLLSEERAIQAVVQGVPYANLSDDDVLSRRQSLYVELEEARGEIKALSGQVQDFEARIEAERNRLVGSLEGDDDGMSLSQRIVAISRDQRNLRDERNQLLQRLSEIEGADGSDAETLDLEKAASAQVEQLRRDRDELLAQRQRLEEQLASILAGAGAEADTVKAMDADRDRMVSERDQLRERWMALQGLAVPGDVSILVTQMLQERGGLKAQMSALEIERDTLAAEHSKLSKRLNAMKDTERAIAELQREVKHLAGDREAALHQRDAIRQQRDEVVKKFEELKERAQSRIKTLEHQATETQRRVTAMGGSSASGQTMTGRGAIESDSVLVTELSQATARIVDLEREVHTLSTRKPVVKSEGLPAEQVDRLIALTQELRTPVTSMAGYIDLLLKETVGILGEMQRRFLQRVSANTARLSGMIEDLVRMWAVETNKVTLQFEPVDMLTLTEDTITEMSTALREKNIEVILETDDDLPQVRGDAEVLHQVVQQILTNAYLASPSDSQIIIALGPGADADSALLLKVTDSGVGVPAGEEEQVFELRFHGENPVIAGLGDTGIGMALARALVTMHEGQIWIEVAQPRGTQVILQLPTMV